MSQSSTFPGGLTPAIERVYSVPVPQASVTIAPIIVAAKSSADLLDYTFDYTDFLGKTGDTIQGVVFLLSAQKVSAYPLTAIWAIVQDTRVTVFLASGLPGSVVRFALEVTTTQGRVFAAPATIQITAATAAVAPPDVDDLADVVKSNGGVAIATAMLPSGYTANGDVVMIGDVTQPAGTPSFVSVRAESYAGDGSGLTVVVGDKTQTLAEWLASGGADGLSAYQVAQQNGFAGTEAEWLASLVGAAGPAGPAGPQGEAGAIGPQGVKGDVGATGAPGASAYKEAISAGFTGTEAEWLASLKGADGAQGETGPAGPTGPEGPEGPKGDTGATGATGPEGPQGPAGSTASVPQVTVATLPETATLGDVVFCTDATSGLQAHTFPAEGCYLWWNGTAWVDYLGFSYTTGNFPGGEAQVSVQRIQVTYEIDISKYAFIYGTMAVQQNGIIDMQNGTVIKSSTGNTLAAINANTNTDQNATSALAWAADACAPGQATGAGTGRWIYKDTAGNWLDFATGQPATT